MWDTAPASDLHLSHYLPCLRCGHAAHRYLACDVSCECEPAAMPGAMPGAVRRARTDPASSTTARSALRAPGAP